MKTIQELKNRKVPIVRIDPALEQYRDTVLFPEKLEKANQMLKTARLPGKKPRSQQNIAASGAGE